MSVSGISTPQTFATPAQQTHHGHHARSAGGSAGTGSAAATPSTADESIEQLAEQGDPTAIAELRAERQQPGASQGRPASGGQTPAERTGASEPGKGAEVDEYA